MSILNYLWLIPLLPLIGSAANGLFGRHFSRKTVAFVGLVFVGLAFILSLWAGSALFQLPQDKLPYISPGANQALPWIAAGDFKIDFSFYLDQLSLVMILVVTGVGFLIHIYSVGYMEHEGGYYRFFCYLNLFMFFMLMLVLASSYLLMFVGWEGVGLASYLLIGFFFTKDSAANAGKKAFIVNRIGDFGFLIAMFLLLRQFGSLDYGYVFRQVSNLHPETHIGLLTTVALLLMLGAAGKSAQIPLYVWLPDAMEGPTPVSALIHAATMVTAGVYMVARSNAIFSRAPIALTVVAVIGAVTAFFAATIGMAQNDIKRVLAYSTISQLGYMFLACGVAAYSAAIFHLMTHAFFKALLFLCAGSVIHSLGGEQDMRNMGGLRQKIPWTFATMTVGTLAIAGTPFFSGFFSKDEILWKAWSSPNNGHWTLWLIGLITAGITSFYMFRLWFMTFFGERRGQHAEPEHAAHSHDAGHIHESPWIMLAPLVILAVLAFAGGYVGVPSALGGHDQFGHFLAPVLSPSSESAAPAGVKTGESASQNAHEEEEQKTERIFTGASVGVAAIGFFFAWLLYSKRRDLPGRITSHIVNVYALVRDKYRIDELYGWLFVRPVVEGSRRFLWQMVDVGTIDALVNDAVSEAQEASERTRRMQSGNVRSYAGWVAIGAAAVVAYMIWIGLQ
ncbi:MAG TPA: NADH-quinone oxidoreductase subunit L [Terriglobales bacterium]|nr:NADH-quinone oxidoreductase subunit L [Terriglobales bacterium]